MIWAVVASNISLTAAIVVVVLGGQRERERLTAAALQANNLPDAARRVVKSQEDDRIKAHLKMQQELRDSGGIFSEPLLPKKPEGI